MSEGPYLSDCFPDWLQKLLGVYNPYRENHPLCWKANRLTQCYRVRTPGRFNVYYRLVGTVEREDIEAFRTAEMIKNKEEKIAEVIDSWHREVFTPALSSTFFSLGFSRSIRSAKEHATVWFFRLDENAIQFDNHGHKTISTTDKGADARPWQKYGCVVKCLRIEYGVLPEDIQRNYKMLSAEQIVRAQQNEHYTDALEAAAAAAMYECDKIHQQIEKAKRIDHKEAGNFAVWTQGIDWEQEICWKKSGAYATSEWETLGFREDDHMSADPWSEATNGTRVLVAHSYKNEDKIQQHLQEGKTYHYTFFLKNTSTKTKHSWIRLQVSIPSAAERAKLFEWQKHLVTLNNTLQGLKAYRVENTREKKLNDLLRRLQDEVNFRVTFLAKRKEIIDAVKNSKTYKEASKTERNELIDDVERMTDPNDVFREI